MQRSSGLKKPVQIHQMQTALEAALQIPAENPNPVLCLETSGDGLREPAAESCWLLRFRSSHCSRACSGNSHLGENTPSRRNARSSWKTQPAFRFGRRHSGRINVYGTDITANLEAQRAQTNIEESKNKDVFLTAMSHRCGHR